MYISFGCSVLLQYHITCTYLQVYIRIQFFTIVFRDSGHNILIVALRKGVLCVLYASGAIALTLYA